MKTFQIRWTSFDKCGRVNGTNVLNVYRSECGKYKNVASNGRKFDLAQTLTKLFSTAGVIGQLDRDAFMSRAFEVECWNEDENGTLRRDRNEERARRFAFESFLRDFFATDEE